MKSHSVDITGRPIRLRATTDTREMKNLLRLIRLTVYVVVAYDTDRLKMRECSVFWSLDKVRSEAERLKEVYGGANVMFASRRIL